ncbi:MAG: glutamate--tRNA ligase [Proteobacteria bacterium]|nr:glutamate--tRNA ligase [Pseudomonadota bacterium]
MSATTAIKVRFPPSPTGKMHLGNARTALFNWLFARHAGGQFLLRIEDTDKERSTPENITFIHDALKWLGLGYDNEPFLQSTRQSLHVEAATRLVEQELAYKDTEGVTRFKVPAGATTWADLVQGEITIENKQVEDFALLRSDGSPTYHLGVVMDDIFQGITHVIRGDDHINNTPKQIMLYAALGEPVPAFGHLPLILGPDGEKLSKRHGAVSIQDLRAEGYLPQAIFNFMLRLGWGHGDQELFTVEEATAAFDISNVSKGPARFDAAKLKWYNQHYLKTLPFGQILPHLVPFLPDGAQTHKADLERLEALWPDLTARAQTLPEIVTAATAFITDPTRAYTAEHTAILLEGHDALHHLYDALSSLPEWQEEALKAAIHHQVEHMGGNFKAVGRPLRVALTAATGGPDLARIMAVLGQSEVLRRLKVSLHHIHENGGHHH